MKSLQRLLPIPYLLLLVLATVSPLHADGEAVLWTGEVQLKIADAFMEEGEYYRAVTEYKKFLILFPDSGKADYASFEIGMAYFKGEEYGAAARAFLAVREKYPKSSYAVQAGYLEGISQWKMKNCDRARVALETLVEQHPDSEYAPRSLVAICLAALDENKAEVSRQALKRFLDRYPGHPGEENVREAAALIDRYQELPEKSPVLAAGDCSMNRIIAGTRKLCVTRCSPIAAMATAGSNSGKKTLRAPAAIGITRLHCPAMWKVGSTLSITERSPSKPIIGSYIARVASRPRLEISTPLGRPVVPDE